MRSKAKQIVLLAVLAAFTVAGMSVAAGGGGGSTDSKDRSNGRERGHLEFRKDFGDADVPAVLEDIRAAVAKQAPEIAGPVIDKAEKDKKINSEQADKLRQAAADIAAGKRPDIRGLPRDDDVQRVIKEAFAAAGEKAPGIAEPIIDQAVSDKKITEAEGNRIRDMLKKGGPGLAFGRCGHHIDGPHFGGPPGIADEDMRAVLEDVHAAVAKQARAITGPVIDKAEQDGKITAAQADKLRDAAAGPSGGRPRGGPPRLPNLRDPDVREVLEDAFDAIGKKRAEIAKPIIDKAVSDKKITETQADQLRSMLNRDKGLRFKHHGGPGHFGPGKPPPPDAGPSFQPAPPPVPLSPA
jgi:hypothetical protein